MNCNKCGSPLSLDATVCPVCGTSVFNQATQNSQMMMSNQPMNTNQPQQQVNQNGNMMNGLQLGDFNQNNINQAPLINPNVINQQSISTDDMFSSPKVTVGQQMPLNNQQINQNVNTSMNVNNPINVNANMNYNTNMVQQPLNQSAGTYWNSNNNSTKKVNMKLVILGCAALVLVIVGFFSFKYFEGVQEKRKELEKEEIRKEVEDNIEDYEKQREEKAAQMKKNINLAEENKLYDGSLLFTYENNNNVVSAVVFQIEFFDSANNSLGVVKEYAYPAPYSKFLIKINSLSVKENYSRYEIDITANDYDLIPVDIETNKFVISDTGEMILVQYKNDDDDRIDNLELCILYYGSNKIVGAECSSSTDIEPGNYANFEFEYYYANKYEGLDFDTYKFAVSAYNKPKNDY